MPRPNRPRPLPPDPEDRNDERASWAFAAIEKFEELTGTDREDAVADLLTDLKHWCDRNGMSFHRQLRRAEGMYRDETYQSPNERTEQNENNQQAGPTPTTGERPVDDVPF